MINILFWNVRGIGGKDSQRMLHQVVKEFNVKTLVISEPKVRLDAKFMTRRLGFTHVAANTNNKLWMFWDFQFQIDVLFASDQLLHVKATSPLLPDPIEISAVYAKCTNLLGYHFGMNSEMCLRSTLLGLWVLLGANAFAYFTFERLCDGRFGDAEYVALFNKSM
ncbi:hypothetical protein CDL12_18613 [Handroanthus impetiginosus]|uniref:Endonuclease/exonuclease/phosphatase domain-containing protein n=1 Tax=Handroanthus impetiginosus TaxID=429701 RepID=A0A2G9GUA3_9LAMI|nr:hypothetical protein CDL12_18613 [Handroanthus impetiginosus]